MLLQVSFGSQEPASDSLTDLFKQWRWGVLFEVRIEILNAIKQTSQ
jgi:hypothetical protein